MRYRLLGKSGLRVSELCLGAMTFGEDYGWGASKDESRRIFDSFAEAGGNFIDTANFYTGGTSEKFVGEFVGSERERFVVATKYTSCMRPGDPNGGGNHRKNMVQALDASLKRLQTDYVDLYWLHAWDFTTPIEEVLRAFDDMVCAGKILYAGVSDTPAWIVSQANTLADLRGWTPFVGLQIEYNLIQRTTEHELLPMARALDIGVTAWSPLASGLLTGKYNRSSAGSEPKRLDAAAFVELSERNLSIAEAVGQVAEETGCTPSQAALAWILAQPGGIIPIIGSRKLSQFEDNLRCLEVKLSPEQLARLNEISQPPMTFPHNYLGNKLFRDIIFGGTYDSVINHHQ